MPPLISTNGPFGNVPKLTSSPMKEVSSKFEQRAPTDHLEQDVAVHASDVVSTDEAPDASWALGVPSGPNVSKKVMSPLLSVGVVLKLEDVVEVSQPSNTDSAIQC